MAKLKYCTLRDAKAKGPCTVYVALPDEQRLNPAVIDDPSFPEIKAILESHGLKHVILMTFRSLPNANIKYRALHADLKKSGFVRDQAMADAIHEQTESLKASQRRSILVVPYNTSAGTQSHTGIPTFNTAYNVNWNRMLHGGMVDDFMRMARVPTGTRAPVIEVGGRLDLYVYLFLRVNPTSDKSIDFNLEFDLFSRESDVLRRYVKTIRCTFIRKKNDTEDIMYLESEKTLRDILKEVDFLYNIRLVDSASVMEGDRPLPVVYNAIELKDFLDLDGRMSLQIDIDQNYDEVLMLSEEIGRKKAAHDKNMQVPIALIKKASKSIVQRMEQRMLHYSNKEDYELAASYRKNKLYIEDKMKWLDDLENKGVDRLNSEEYESAFTMKDMDF